MLKTRQKYELISCTALITRSTAKYCTHISYTALISRSTTRNSTKRNIKTLPMVSIYLQHANCSHNKNYNILEIYWDNLTARTMLKLFVEFFAVLLDISTVHAISFIFASSSMYTTPLNLLTVEAYNLLRAFRISYKWSTSQYHAVLHSIYVV